MALSKEKKQQIKTDFEAGNLPISKIAKKYKVNAATIFRLEKQGKWSEYLK